MKKIGVVAFAFGVPWNIRSNRQIAKIASDKAKGVQGKIYSQRFVAIHRSIPVEYMREPRDSPAASTLVVAREAVKWAFREGITELWVAAAKPHLWRVRRDLLRVQEEQGVSIEILVCEEIETYSAHSWFCLDSGQIRTQSAWAWYSREWVLRILPFFVYKRIAR